MVNSTSVHQDNDCIFIFINILCLLFTIAINMFWNIIKYSAIPIPIPLILFISLICEKDQWWKWPSYISNSLEILFWLDNIECVYLFLLSSMIFFPCYLPILIDECLTMHHSKSKLKPKLTYLLLRPIDISFIAPHWLTYTAPPQIA